MKTDHALNVFADPAEPPYVSRDEGEGDRMEARGGSLGGRHGREVHLHSHLRIIVNHILSFIFGILFVFFVQMQVRTCLWNIAGAVEPRLYSSLKDTEDIMMILKMILTMILKMILTI